jgi:hypothetical protein
MIRLSSLFVFILLSAAPALADNHLLGGVASGTWGEIEYKEIDNVTVTAFPIFLNHPYQIDIERTPLGQMITCQLYDAEGNPKATKVDNSGDGRTVMHFGIKEPGLDAKCFVTSVERRTRPSS